MFRVGDRYRHICVQYSMDATLCAFLRLLFGYGAFTLFGAPFQELPLVRRMLLKCSCEHSPTTCVVGGPTSSQPYSWVFRLPFLAFSRPYLPNHNCSLFLRVIGCFDSPRIKRITSGLQAACAYPEHFAACHDPHFAQAKLSTARQ